jgi:hypothetical protein
MDSGVSIRRVWKYVRHPLLRRYILEFSLETVRRSRIDCDVVKNSRVATLAVCLRSIWPDGSTVATFLSETFM